MGVFARDPRCKTSSSLWAWLCLALGWLLPGHYPPWVTYQQQWLAALGAALIAAAALADASPRPVRWPWLAVVVAAFAAVPLLQVLGGQVRFISDGVLPALYLLAFAISMAAGAMLASRQGLRWVDALTAAVIVAAMLSTAIALVQWLGMSTSLFVADLRPGARPYANLAQPNHLATLLGMGVAGLLGAYERRRLGGASTALAVGWLGFGLVMTQSRTGWLFVVLLVLWWALMRRRAGLRLQAQPVVAGVALFVLGIVCWAPLNQAMLILANNSLAERLQPGPRWALWAPLWDAIWQAPWLGYGWMQVALAQQAVALGHPATYRMFQDSHNLILDLVLWMGLPLGGLLAAVVAAWLVLQVRRCRDAQCWALLAAAGAVLVHAMLEYPLDYTYFLLPLGLLMGSVEGLSGTPPGRAWPRWTLGLPLAGMVAMLLWIGEECMQLEDASRQLRLFLVGVHETGVTTVPPPDVKLLDAPREYHRYWLTPAVAGMSDEQLNWMRDVAQRNAFPPALLRYALAAGLNGRTDEAASTLAVLCKLHTEERCDEGRQSWALLQQQHPELRAIKMPARN